MWKVFTKAGKPGWAAIIPYYSTYTLFEIAGWSGWIGVGLAVLLTFGGLFHSTPIIALLGLVYLVFYVIIAIKIAEKFGKSVAFAIFGLVLFWFVGYPMLAFGKAEYKSDGKNPSNPSAPNQVQGGGTNGQVVSPNQSPPATPTQPTVVSPQPSATVSPQPTNDKPPGQTV